MPSTYTTNLGIEKVPTGEQSGTWGDTTNTNFDIIDQAINGIAQITLASAGTSGSPNTLDISDGAVSNGRNKFIEFIDGGDLGATAYVQLTPNDAEKIIYIRNSLSSSRSLIVFQGTYSASNDYEIANGKDVLVKFDGGGSGAVVTQVMPHEARTGSFAIDNLKLDGNTLSSTNTNGNITLSPNGTGSVAIGKAAITGGTMSSVALSSCTGNISQFTNDSSYSTTTGTVTSVAAGAGLSGGTITSTGTISLPTVITANTYGSTSDGTKIDTITVDAYGRITAVATGTTGSSSTTGTVTSVSGGTGLTGTVTTSGSISIANNGVGATQLNVTGNGTTSQFLRSDGDGSFTWATPTDTNTTYTAGAGLNLSSTTFSVESDLRSDAWQIGRDTNDYYIVNTTSHDWYLDGNLDMKLENDGDLHVDGDVVAYSTTTSDAKFKDNVTVIENALDKVNQLKGVEFDWNATSRKGSHDIGLIAQEVEKIIPYIVREKTLQTGEFESSPIQAKTIDYEKLVAVLIEAVKELSDKLDKKQCKCSE